MDDRFSGPELDAAEDTFVTVLGFMLRPGVGDGRTSLRKALE